MRERAGWRGGERKGEEERGRREREDRREDGMERRREGGTIIGCFAMYVCLFQGVHV